MVQKEGKELPARPTLPSLRNIPDTLLNLKKREVFAAGPGGRDPEKELSPFDFDSIPTDSSDEEILEWVASWGVPKRFLFNNITPTDILIGRPVGLSEEYYRFLTARFADVISYTKERWGMAPYLAWANGIEHTVFRSSKDIVKFLRASVDARKKKGKEEEGIMHCALANLMYACVVLDTIEIEEIMRHATTLEVQMIDGVADMRGNGLIPPLFSHFERDHELPDNAVTLAGASFENATATQNVKFCMRGKSFRSALDRIQQPRGSGESILVDGVGMRFTCELKDMPSVILQTLSWLAQYRGITNIEIEDQGMYGMEGEKEMRGLVRTVAKIPALLGTSVTRVPSKKNAASAGRFRSLKVFCTSATNPNIRYEIQLVLPFNKHNKKDSHHAYYEAARDIMNITRLFGACPHHSFNFIVSRVADELGLDKKSPHDRDKVERNLFGRKVHKVGRFMYIHEAIYTRWREIEGGWITEQEYESLMKKTRENREARRKQRNLKKQE